MKSRSQIEPSFVIKCLEKQDSKRSADLRKYYIKNIFFKEKLSLKNPKTMKEKWGNIYPIMKAIEYLPLKERLKLLLISKEWRSQLEKKVVKSFLVKQPNNKDIEKKRIELWLMILKYVDLYHYSKNIKKYFLNFRKQSIVRSMKLKIKCLMIQLLLHVKKSLF